ncbi:hypothetical protein [Oscillibacter sp.]|uniref:hypothetical protein n=1 Tax=Oscillibacter sp. TaxID=1945593 RepID=UPI00289B314E|nr:hypothetical protein [Oscillibacter sp.]
MADLTFNTTPGQTIDRNLLALYLNTGTAAAPEWHRIGKRVEDSSMEMDWGQETKTDIFGDVWTTQKTPVKTQTFDPCELDAGDPAQVMLWNLAIKDEDAAALCALDMLVAHLYVDVGASGAKFAVRNSACAISPTSLGGAGGGFLGMPLDVTFGGQRTVGSVVSADGEITFTPEGSGD